MITRTAVPIRPHQLFSVIAAVAAVAAVAASAALLPPAVQAQELVGPQLADRPVTMETLLDRIQIEDFITRYYYDLSVGKSHELADYFTEDALLDRFDATFQPREHR